MFYSIILYSILFYYIYYLTLYYNLLYYLIFCFLKLYYVRLCYIILYHVILSYVILYYITPYHITLYYLILYRIILYHIILWFIILCYITLFYIISYQIIWSYLILFHIKDIIWYCIISYDIIYYHIVLYHIILYYSIVNINIHVNIDINATLNIYSNDHGCTLDTCGDMRHHTWHPVSTCSSLKCWTCRANLLPVKAKHLAIASGCGLWQLKMMRRFWGSQESKYRYSFISGATHRLYSWALSSRLECQVCVFLTFSHFSQSDAQCHIETISQMNFGYDFEHPDLAAGFIRFSCRISVVTSPCVSWSTKVNGLRQDKGAGNQLHDLTNIAIENGHL